MSDEMRTIKSTISKRNSLWEKNKDIPSWVDVNTVDLDQFFTKSDIAQDCYNKLMKYLDSQGVSIKDCLFIEPSAGSGAFFNLLPKKQRIGLDIFPLNDEIIEQEFLSWTPPKTKKKIVVIGNPPFGYRAWLALLFMQKVSTFADYVGFILPMAFQSEGKGSPKNRVKGMKTVMSEILPKNSFETPDGKDYKINTLFQIWEKGQTETIDENIFKDYVEIFTLQHTKGRICGQNKIQRASFYLQRTFFNNPPRIMIDSNDVRYGCAYGFIIKKDEETIHNILDKVNWIKYSNLAAHGCRHISMYHIWRALLDYGFKPTN